MNGKDENQQHQEDKTIECQGKIDKFSGNHLKLYTFLSPTIPLAFYHHVMNHLEKRLKSEYNIDIKCTVHVPDPNDLSGPVYGTVDPFESEKAYIAHMCAPYFIRYKRKCKDVQLLGVSLVPIVASSNQKPEYFSVLVTRKDAIQQQQQQQQPSCNDHVQDHKRLIERLKGLRFGYNDVNSLSGRLNLMGYLIKSTESLSCHSYQSLNDISSMIQMNPQLKENVRMELKNFFKKTTCTKGHTHSLNMLLNDEIDCASFDSQFIQNIQSNPSNNELYEKFSSELRIHMWLGPVPIQPFVISSKHEMEQEIGISNAIKQILLKQDEQMRARMNGFGFLGFAEVKGDDFNALETEISLIEEFNDCII